MGLHETFQSQYDLSRLTVAQRSIAAAVASGLSNKQIAATSGIAEATVRAHLLSASKRLRLNNRVQIAVWYARAKMMEGRLLPPDSSYDGS